MYKFIYGTTRSHHFTNTQDLGQLSLNGGYDTRFYNQGQFLDYEQANITKLDLPIPLDRYTGKIPVINPETEEPTWEFVPKLTRFVRLKYSDLYTNSADLTASIEKSGSGTNVQIFSSPQDAVAWIKANTNLEEVEPWKFLITPEHADYMNPDVVIPAEYIEINVSSISFS